MTTVELKNLFAPLALGLGTQELMVILVIVVLLFGAKKIPELMRGVGRGVGELQKGLEEGKRTMNKAIEESADEVETTSKPAGPVA
jgi:sec-independent protein translocase protein TatA